MKDITTRTDQAKVSLASQMDAILVELKSIGNNPRLSCNKEDIRGLRSATFYSPIFKEFGLFNSDYHVFCTNLGPRNFKLFSSIVERIEASPSRRTVALVKSHTLGDRAFLVFYKGEKGIGVSGLAPPKRLGSYVDRWLTSGYAYQLTLGKQMVVSNGADIEGLILDKQVRTLDDWSMSLAVYLPERYYWQMYQSMWPCIILFAVFLFVLLSAIHWSFLYYRRSLPQCIKRAIRNNAMEVYFQPIVSLNENSTHELEALIRWHSPYHGQVSPLSIVEVSERLGLIDDLTWLVIRKVGAFYRQNADLLKDIRISVNVDRHSLIHEDFAPTLAKVMDEWPELKGRLGLEVTETTALNSIELPIMVSRFEHIKALDIRLSVDDFGTGYAGLDFLRRFPYDTLKLDQVFIASLKDDQFTRQVLTSVTKLAKELNMEVVAEGVERKDQLEAVRELGVERVQGYYFCRPLPIDQIIEWLVAEQARKSRL
ncbi:EAL domain-containing protein [Marinomonas posidonica]|uniref:EAL domain-containing protein n=1 Tax=Marinomonas posidonica TaxID=936476 RepID=UPI001FE13BCC|nr:EAL domain-containing protein [Marinomonas posidonica]